MEMLFSQEEVWEMERRHIWKKAEAQGAAKGEARGRDQGERNRDALYGELLKKLKPLGRVEDLIAAIADKSKLSALAQEFGLEL